ncbi:MAG TPA: hypothetical protein VG537_02465 [Candidatus Kapabacteria bacterium]|jgi:hypothetical protein|nr:hypothetical protein [Candidatus Kapabacteria bacterium]
MSDQEVFSDPEQQDDDQSKHDDRQARIHAAFGSLNRTLGQRAREGERLSEQDEKRVLGIREAALSGDRARATEHLTKVKQESSWLYEELMKHPEISAIMRELSIMGL